MNRILILVLLAGAGFISCTPGNESTDGFTVPEDSTQQFSARMFEEYMAAEMEVIGSVAEADESDEIESSRSNAITTAVKQVNPAIVSITVTGVTERQATLQDELFLRFFGQMIPREHPFTNMGSGFIISEDGLVITNQHLISGASEVMVVTSDGKTYDARLVGSDELADLALLKINSEEPLHFVEFTDSDNVLVGEWAIALGNSFGLFEDGRPTVTVGVVSATNRDFRPDPNNPRTYVDMIQTDAAINHGNSGGPLLNGEGKVMGVNTFIYTGGTSSGFVGLGFAIPSNRVEQIIDQLLVDGQVTLDFDPGMEFQSMTNELAYRNNLPLYQGLLVTEVNRDGPAFACGVMPGDIIVQIGDERVVSELHAMALFREYEEGENMKLRLLRNQEFYETEMMLRKRVTESNR